MEETSEIKALAVSHFNSGLLCAESVVSALATYQNQQHEVLPKIATAFCSGMSRTCGTCGALTGAIMGISLGLGREDKAESVEKSYQATQKLVSRFETEFGSKNCHELLGCDIGTDEGLRKFKTDGLRTNCVEYTGRAAELAVQILKQVS
ncbi:hypothetical protein NM22_16635 [Vibrio tubiashii]|nr:hypothetical protein NM22_16635 [Vibrio tubiashii]